MRTIICLFAAMALLFSCKKTKDNTAPHHGVLPVAGNWSAEYLGRSIQLAIDSSNQYNVIIPVIVKKESGSAPVTWEVMFKGICVGQNGKYNLEGDGLVILGQHQVTGTALEEARELVYQSIEGLDVAIRRTGEPDGQNVFRLTAQNRKWTLLEPF